MNPRINTLEKNRISYLRGKGAINSDGTLKTNMSIYDPPAENEIFMGINFQVTPDFDFSTNRFYIIDAFKCPKYTEIHDDKSIYEMFTETTTPLGIDEKSFDSEDPFSMNSRFYRSCYKTWTANTKVDPITRKSRKSSRICHFCRRNCKWTIVMKKSY